MLTDDTNAPQHADPSHGEPIEAVDHGASAPDTTEDHEVVADAGEAQPAPSQRVVAFLRRAGAMTREHSVKAARHVAERGVPMVGAAARRVGDVGSHARDSVRTKLVPSDDVEAFERHATPLLDPDAAHSPLPITAVTGVALAAASVGAFANATDVMRFTRPLMDADTASLQRWLAEVFPAATNATVSRAMDTIPGSDHAGGMFHRLHHGHDIASLVELVQSFGFEGAATWFNHVGLRDLWTPHGVPWLPAGAGDVHAWLVDLGMQKTLAATLLSVNAATLAGSVLGLLAMATFRRAIRVSIERSEAKKRFDHAVAALDAGDPLTATQRFESALRLPGMTARLRLMAAMSALEAARNSDDEETRRRIAKDASYWLREYLTDEGGANTLQSSAPMWAGADVSMAGIAAALYGQAILLAHGGDTTGALEIDRMRMGVAAAIDHGDRLIDPPKLGPLARPARPLSAAVNYVIALENVLAYPTRLVTPSVQPDVLKRRVREALLSALGTEREGYARRALEQLEYRYPERAFSPA